MKRAGDPRRSDQDQRISDAVARETSRLRGFIRRRVHDARDAEDILQDVFSALVEANRLLVPIDHVTGWLFRVARNRITDLFRRRTREARATEPAKFNAEGEELLLDELLPSLDAGPDAAYARGVLVEALDDALEELPAEQRDVFVAHELMGYTFKDLAEQSGVSMNTMLSRKRYAVLHLRERLQSVYDEFSRR